MHVCRQTKQPCRSEPEAQHPETHADHSSLYWYPVGMWGPRPCQSPASPRLPEPPLLCPSWGDGLLPESYFNFVQRGDRWLKDALITPGLSFPPKSRGLSAFELQMPVTARRITSQQFGKTVEGRVFRANRRGLVSFARTQGTRKGPPRAALRQNTCPWKRWSLDAAFSLPFFPFLPNAQMIGF